MPEVGSFLGDNAVEGEVNDYRSAGGCVFRKTFSQPLANFNS